MLKKLSDDKIVEKDEVKWTDEVSTFLMTYLNYLVNYTNVVKKINYLKN